MEPQYDPELERSAMLEEQGAFKPYTPPPLTGDADRGIGMDLAPDFVRQIPAAVIEADRRQTEADDYLTRSRQAIMDHWLPVIKAATMSRAQDFLDQAGNAAGAVGGALGAGGEALGGAKDAITASLGLTPGPGTSTPEEGTLRAWTPEQDQDPVSFLRNWAANLPREAGGANVFNAIGLISDGLNGIVSSVAKDLPGGETGVGQAVYGMAMLPPAGKMEEAASLIVGAGRDAPEVALPALSALITTFGKAIPEGATAWDAQRMTAGLDNGVTVLAHHIGASVKAFGLSAEEQTSVHQLLEGVPGEVTPKAQQVADLLRQTFDSVIHVAQQAGVTEAYVENYFQHLVQRPANEIAKTPSLSPGMLSSWTRAAMSRLTDEAGNVRFPTVGDLQAYLAEAQPTWKVNTDLQTVVEANVKGLTTAANHAQLIDRLKGYLVENADKPGEMIGALASSLKQPASNFVRVDLPDSLAKFVYRGQAPEEGPVVLARTGVLGEVNSPLLNARLRGLSEAIGKWEPGEAPDNLVQAFRDVGSQMGIGSEALDSALAKGELPKLPGQPVIAQGTPIWAEKTTAQALQRYLEPLPPVPTGLNNPIAQGVISAYLKANVVMVRGTLMNFMVHGDNLITATIGQYSDPRQLAGIGSDLAYARRFMSDPVFQVQEMQGAAGQLNLAAVGKFTQDLAKRAGPIPEEAGALMGLARAAARPFAWASDAGHRILFEQLGQRLQLMNYNGNLRTGMSPEAAAATANALFGQFTTRDRTQIANMVAKYVPLAGNWQTGQVIRMVSTVTGRPGLLTGYAANLSPEARAEVANAVRANTLREFGAAIASTALMTKVFTGDWPWNNAEPGRLLDIGTPWRNENGDRVYIPQPFFRLVQDMFRIGTGTVSAVQKLQGARPEETLSARIGTSGLDTVTGKLAPVLTAAAALAQGEQYPGGPPIVNTEEPVEKAAQVLAAAANRITPFGIQATRNPPRSADELRPPPGSANLSITGPGGFGWTEDRGVHGPTDPNTQMGGAVVEALGGREVYGPSFRGAGNEEEQRQAKAAFEASKFAPSTVAVFRSVDLWPSAATTGAPLPLGGGVSIQLTPRETKPYQEAVRTYLDKAVDHLMEVHGSNGTGSWNALSAVNKRTVLGQLETTAKEQAIGDIARKLREQGTLQERVAAARKYKTEGIENRVEAATR